MLIPGLVNLLEKHSHDDAFDRVDDLRFQCILMLRKYCFPHAYLLVTGCDTKRTNKSLGLLVALCDHHVAWEVAGKLCCLQGVR